MKKKRKAKRKPNPRKVGATAYCFVMELELPPNMKLKPTHQTVSGTRVIALRKVKSP